MSWGTKRRLNFILPKVEVGGIIVLLWPHQRPVEKSDKRKAVDNVAKVQGSQHFRADTFTVPNNYGARNAVVVSVNRILFSVSSLH